MAEGTVEVTAEADGDRHVVCERNQGSSGPDGNQPLGMHKPIEVSTVFMSGTGGVGNTAVAVPDRGEVWGG